MHKPVLRDAKAAAFFAEAVFDRNFVVLERHFERLIRTHQRDLLPVDTGALRIDDERRDAAAVAFGPGARVENAPVRAADAGDPHLRAVDDVAIALQLGARRDRARRIGAAARLADRHERLLTLRDRRDAVFLDLVPRSVEDRRAAGLGRTRRRPGNTVPCGISRLPPRRRTGRADRARRHRIRRATARTKGRGSRAFARRRSSTSGGSVIESNSDFSSSGRTSRVMKSRTVSCNITYSSGSRHPVCGRFRFGRCKHRAAP